MRSSAPLLFALLPLLCGCLEMDQVITIEPDGAGTIALEYSIAERASTQLSAMVRLAGQMAEAGGEAAPALEQEYVLALLIPDEERIRQTFQRYEAQGVTIQELALDSRNAEWRVKLTLAFTDLARLAQTDFYADFGFAVQRLPDGDYRLWRKVQATGDDAAAVLADEASVKAVTPFLRGFDVTVSVRTPGDVLRANTMRKSLRQASWKYAFDRDPRSFLAFQNQDVEIVFKGAGVTLPAIPHPAKRKAADSTGTE